MKVKLIVTGGTSSGREIPLPATVFLIGRGPRCHLRPHCRSVSKLHCALAMWAGKVVVRDLKSANGTLVNGQRIEGETRVEDGDTLQVGSLTFTFRLSASDGDVEPVPVVRESEVKWLLDARADPSLALARTSTAIPLLGYHETDEAMAHGGGLSAGVYLRDYFGRRSP
jgi:pSer/pThr/pTyr-binding forkhead associated (FHA) protein